MQDIHALGGTAGGAGGGGRLFTGSSGGGDRRLRPHNTQNQSLTSLMTSPGESSLLGFSMAGVSTYGVQENHHGTVVLDQRPTPMILTRGHEELKMDCGYLDGHRGFGSLQQSRLGIGGLAGMEWQINGEEGVGGGSGDQGLFDFGGGDDQAYLVQNHWPDNDPSLNFPPLV